MHALFQIGMHAITLAALLQTAEIVSLESNNFSVIQKRVWIVALTTEPL